MWERRTKNQFGQIEQITKESCFTREPIYDDIQKNGHAYNKANLTVQYTVEWLAERNYEAFDKSQKMDSDINPWELYDEYLTDSLGLAIRQMMIRFLDDTCDDPRLFMYIKDENGNDAEACATLPADTAYYLRRMVQENINRKLNAYEETISEQEKEIELYKSFITEYHAETAFEEYRKEIL